MVQALHEGNIVKAMSRVNENRLEILVSAVKKDVMSLAKTMNLQADSIVINQTDCNDYVEYEHKGHKIKCYSFNEKGVGLSRNNSLLRASKEIILFSDDDIVYDDGLEEKILKQFDEHPEADMLLFNMRVGQERATYYTENFHRVHIWNAGRYPTYSFAIRRDKIHASAITFSLLFGGGAKYSNGEDSLFLKDCIEYGLKVYAVPIEIGEEVPRQSTWFNGYTEKFFIDRGVLYHFLYGKLAGVMAVRLLIAHRDIMCNEISIKEAIKLMMQGIRSVKGY